MTDLYLIRVLGWLDPQWAAWFEPLKISHSAGTPAMTALIGAVRDQTALRAVLNRLWDLNLTVIQVQKLDELEAAND